MSKIGTVLFLLLTSYLLHGADELCVNHIVVPEYPRIAEVAGLQGTIVLNLTISTTGKVLSVESSGLPLLKSIAEGIVKGWTFSKVDSAAGLRTLAVKFEYVLDNGPRSVTLDLPDRIRIKGVIPTVETDSPK